MKQTKFIGLLLAAFIFIGAPPIRAQTVTSAETNQVVADAPKATDSITLQLDDSTKQVTVPADQITAPSDLTIFGIKIPAWVGVLVSSLITLLPVIQLILKRIPTDVSVKIGGILGKFLDILTFFQKDVGPDGKSLKKTNMRLK